MGLALEVTAARFGWAFERAVEPAEVPAGGVARNRRSTGIRIRSAHRQTQRPCEHGGVCCR